MCPWLLPYIGNGWPLVSHLPLACCRIGSRRWIGWRSGLGWFVGSCGWGASRSLSWCRTLPPRVAMPLCLPLWLLAFRGLPRIVPGPPSACALLPRTVGNYSSLPLRATGRTTATVLQALTCWRSTGHIGRWRVVAWWSVVLWPIEIGGRCLLAVLCASCPWSRGRRCGRAPEMPATFRRGLFGCGGVVMRAIGRASLRLPHACTFQPVGSP